jgi:hypothetical protein
MTMMALDNVINAINTTNTIVAENDDSGSVNSRNSFRRCFHICGASCIEAELIMSGVFSWCSRCDSVAKSDDSILLCMMVDLFLVSGE